MLGFLLKNIILSLIMFGIFSLDCFINIVTFGGQLMGALIIALTATISQVISKMLSSRFLVQNIFVSFLMILVIAILVNNLPGYTVKNDYLLVLGIAVFCVCSIFADKYVENR